MSAKSLPIDAVLAWLGVAVLLAAGAALFGSWPSLLKLHATHDAVWVYAWIFGVIVVFAGAATVPLWLLLRLTGRAGPWLAGAGFALAVMLLYVDCRTGAMLGVRLDSPVAGQAFELKTMQREAALGISTWLTIGLALLFAAAFGGLSLQRLRDRLGRGSVATKRWIRALFAALMGTGLIGMMTVWPAVSAAVRNNTEAGDLVLLGSLLRSPHEPSKQSAATYPTLADDGAPPKAARKPDVVMILVESLRSDHATPTLMPDTHANAKAHGCLVAPNHHSGSHVTSWGVFSWLYGVDSHHFDAFADARLRSYPLRALKAQGYDVVGVTASGLRGWDRSDFMLDEFDPFVELTKRAGYQNDQDVLAWVTQWSKDRDPTRPYVLFIFLVSPHHNYTYPPEFERYKPVMPADYNHFLGSDKLIVHKERILNRYKNSVLWTDNVIGRLLKLLRSKTGDRGLLTAVAGDHGEEFFDHGLLGHGAARLYKARTGTPLFLCAPGDAPVPMHAVSSHVDVMPTVLDALGLGDALPARVWSDGASLLRPHKVHDVLVTGYGYPRKGRKLALVGANDKIWLLRDETGDGHAVTRRMTLADVELPQGAKTQHEASRLRSLQTRLERFERTRSTVTRDAPASAIILAEAPPWLALADASIDGKPTPGASIEVTWVWIVKQRVPAGWQTFVHLVGPNVFANLDHVPVDFTYPVERWLAGDTITDRHRFTVPKDVAVGTQLTLRTGLWHPKNGRAALRSAARNVVKDGVDGVTFVVVGNAR